MILNHKNAIAFIVENRDLFGDTLAFATVKELHRIISDNLGIDSGIRMKPGRITASNYLPINNPHQLREYMDRIQASINRASDPFARAYLAFYEFNSIRGLSNILKAEL